MGGLARRRATDLVDVARRLADEVDALSFDEPVAYVYNPLRYAWAMHEQFLERFGQGRKRVVFLGMNPGPWGMAQTGVPFGEVSFVRDWMGLGAEVERPEREHPKRPVQGLDCPRAEVSGARLWGWAKEQYGTAEKFFSERMVLNYCPLVFMEESARNRTPDKLPVVERKPLGEACDQALIESLQLLDPELAIGVGAYAEAQLQRLVSDSGITIGRVLHPSPASPIANRGWAEQARKQLASQGAL